MRSFLLLLFLILVGGLPLYGQICQGNLGENIFLQGDFGTGVENVLPVDPQIAPGYQYQTQPPPNDGFYTITNDIGQWNNPWDWLEVQDNSPNPLGYMMVVNASFEPGIFYEQEVIGLCENTLYEFSADVINLHGPGDNLILPNISFLLDGVTQYSTGPVLETGLWQTYGFTFSTQPGQTSVVLALQNNASGGAGNDLAIDNISFRPCGPEALILPEEVAIICEDGSPIDLEATIIGNQYDDPAVQWQQSFDGGLTWVNIPGATGLVYTHTDVSGGFYYFRYLLANGTGNLDNFKCRVVSNVKVLQIIPKFYSVVDTLCEGLTFPVGNNSYAETGIYTDSLLSFFGCDSIVTLDLTIVPDPEITAVFTTQDPSCENTSDGVFQIDTILNGVEPYTIVVEADTLFEDNFLGDLASGNYDLRIIDAYGCTLLSSFDLLEPEPLLLELGPDWSVELGESITLDAVVSRPVDTILWTPLELQDCWPECFSFVWAPASSTIVSATVLAGENCSATDSLVVEVIPIRKVFIPSVFSPNFDGVNDSFTIYGATPNVQQVLDLKVFDRWGALVFQSSNFVPGDESAGWDGTFRGQSVADGVYTYVAEVLFFDNLSYVYSGSITVLK